MSVFLTPDGVPFYGGTYFPPRAALRHALLPPGAGGDRRRPGATEREKMLGRAPSSSDARRSRRRPSRHARRHGARDAQRRRSTRQRATLPARALRPRPTAASAARPSSRSRWSLEFLLRRYAATERRRACLRDGRPAPSTPWPRGGIYDQLGGGFHRYRTDDVWLVPHFEKMLYDNAQLARVYLHAWQVTGERALPPRRDRDARLRAARDDRTRAGGFYCAAGRRQPRREEGTFFVWTPEEIAAALRRRRATAPTVREATKPACSSTAYGVTRARQLRGARRSCTLAIDAGRSSPSGTGSTADEVERRLDALRRAPASRRASGASGRRATTRCSPPGTA